MGQTILVVDDEPDVVELVGYHLRVRGFHVVSAANGKEALRKAEEILPDAIVLDVMMEGLDGLSVCEVLRAQPSTRTIPVIVLTAATSEIARVNSSMAGASDFVSKPFSPQDLIRRVTRLLERTANKVTETDQIPDVPGVEHLNS